jgi:hypothetical protein
MEVHKHSSNTDALLDASKEVGLKVNVEKTKVHVHVLSPKCKTNHNVKITKNFLKNEAKFRYLGMTITHQNHIHEEIKNMLNLRNACCH